MCLYAALAVLVGVPVVAGFADLGPHDPSPLVYGVQAMLWAFFFPVVLILPVIALQLLVYLVVLWAVPSRRLAVLLSPVAVGVLFVFAVSTAETAVLAAAGLLFGFSLRLRRGPPAWWQRRPRLLAAAAAGWVACVAAVGLVQPLSAGTGIDVAVAMPDVTYRLACEYDRAGRVRGPAAVGGRAHPRAARACEILDEVGTALVQRDCPRRARSAVIDGVIRGQRVHERVVAAACGETSLIGDEPFVLVPTPHDVLVPNAR